MLICVVVTFNLKVNITSEQKNSVRITRKHSVDYLVLFTCAKITDIKKLDVNKIKHSALYQRFMVMVVV